MKQLWLTVLLMHLFFAHAFAHAPTEAHVSYEAPTQKLAIEVTHPVVNPQRHYIKKIEVFINGGIVTTLMFTEQESATMQTAVVQLKQFKPSDVIEVVMYCSKSGKRSTELKALE